MSEGPSQPKFPKPKVLLVDLPREVQDAILAAGFNAQAGTFGRPYKVPARDSYVRMNADARLPNYHEQEIIIIDLTLPETSDVAVHDPNLSVPLLAVKC